MVWISEQMIENSLKRIGQHADAAQAAIEKLRDADPALHAFLFSDDTRLLTNRERQHYAFLVGALYTVFLDHSPRIGETQADFLNAAVEKNWSDMLMASNTTFREKLDPFFKETTQEDVLAFIEDMLVSEEGESDLTDPGRELIFVLLKTFLDAWQAKQTRREP